jgi:hypothetical protein
MGKKYPAPSLAFSTPTWAAEWRGRILPDPCQLSGRVLGLYSVHRTGRDGTGWGLDLLFLSVQWLTQT